MPSMQRVRKGRVQDGDVQDTWRCPSCGMREQAYFNVDPSHQPGGTSCLQNQLDDLKATVDRIVDRLGGEV